MYSIEQIFIQALEDPSAYNIDNSSIVNYGVKIQKFFSKTEILNCSKNGDYFQECNKEEYKLSMMNYKRKLDLIEYKIRSEVNTRKNDKHIKKLKVSRENLLIKYSKIIKQLNKIK